MTTQSQRLQRTFLLMGAAGALALELSLAALAGKSARVTLERLANLRGVEVGSRVAALASSYMGERRHEIDVLAASPAIVAAARQATQQATQRKLDQLAPAALAQAGPAVGGRPRGPGLPA
jgi:hypothetical protein